MPNYTFENIEGKQWNEQMTIAQCEFFIKHNPHVRQIFDNVYVGTVSSNADWHIEHGVKNMWGKLHKQLRQTQPPERS